MGAYLVFLLDQNAEDGKKILTLPVISTSSEAIPKRVAAELPHLDPILIMTRDQVKGNLDRLDELDAKVKADLEAEAQRKGRRN